MSGKVVYGRTMLGEAVYRQLLLKDAVELLKGFGISCEDPDGFLGKTRLRKGANGSAFKYWLFPGPKGWHRPTAAESKRSLPRIKFVDCGRCWDCRRRKFLKAATDAGVKGAKA